MVSSAAARARRVPSPGRPAGCGRAVEAERGVGPAVPGHVPVHVVVGQHPGGGRAAGACSASVPSIDRAQLGGVPGAAQVGEVEHRVQLVRAQVAGQPRRRRAARPRRSAPGRGIRRRPPARPGRSRARRRGRCRVRTGLVRPESGSAGSLVSSAAESIRTPSTPRSNQNRRMSSNSCADLRVGPVEVRLLGREQVQVPLPGVPSGAVVLVHAGPPKMRLPVVGREVAAGTAAGPEPEPVALGGAGPGRQRRPEPRVLVRAVVRHDVDDRS